LLSPRTFVWIRNRIEQTFSYLSRRHSVTEEGCDLLVTVLEAKDLMIPSDADPDHIDTFVRVYLLPDESDAVQTRVFKSSKHPSYQELFGFFISKQNLKRSLWFHLYHTNAQCTTLIGE
jgi:synaptotagmin-12